MKKGAIFIRLLTETWKGFIRREVHIDFREYRPTTNSYVAVTRRQCVLFCGNLATFRLRFCQSGPVSSFEGCTVWKTLHMLRTNGITHVQTKCRDIKVYGISVCIPQAKVFYGHWSVQSEVVRERLITADCSLTTHVMLKLSWVLMMSFIIP